MADVVQYRLEQMPEELEDMERKGIFTHQELLQVVKKRRDFEYRLKRPSPLKEDFLAYIEYETHFETFRRIRRKSVSRGLVEMGKKKLKRSVSDYAGINRILRVFELATTRFKGDLDLWLRYIDFCKEHRHGRLKKVLVKVARFHPKNPDIWMKAAASEFNDNLNVESARSLMLMGMRACPDSEELWVQFLLMEITYLNKLKTRKVILGEDVGSLIRDHDNDDEKQWKDENKDLFMSLEEEQSNVEKSDVQDEDSENQSDFREQASGIFQATYSGAVKALLSNMNLRKRFLGILDQLNLEDSDSLREEILDGMRKDFAKDPEFWDWLARLQYFDRRRVKNITEEDLRLQLDKAVGIYEESLKIVPSAKMFLLYTKFWMDVISPEGDDYQDLEVAHSSDYAVNFISNLLMVYEKAESMGCMTEDLAYQYISLYLRLGRLEEARTMSEKLCKGKFSGSVKLWEVRISIEMKSIGSKSSSLRKDDLDSTFNLVRDILAKVSISEADSLWHMAIKFFSNHRDYFDKLVQTLMALIAKSTEGGFSVSSAIVNYTLQRDGIKHAREMYKRFLALPHPSLTLHRTCIELESNLAFIGDKNGLVNARKVYESALTNYSQDVGLWQDYFSLENKVGTSETANGIYWRARKTLRDSTGLIAPQ